MELTFFKLKTGEQVPNPSDRVMYGISVDTEIEYAKFEKIKKAILSVLSDKPKDKLCTYEQMYECDENAFGLGSNIGSGCGGNGELNFDEFIESLNRR